MGCKGTILHSLLAVAIVHAVTAGEATMEEPLKENPIPLRWPSKNGYIVPKTVVSDRLRLVFAVGIVGTGHNMLESAFTHMFRYNNLPYVDACLLGKELYPGLVASVSSSPLAYAQARVRLGQRMKELAESERDLEGYPGSIASPQFAVPFRTNISCLPNMMSYPDYGGKDEALQYVDLPLLALAAEADGVDLRLIFLSRSAMDVMISTTQHRDLDKRNPHPKSHRPERTFVRYMQILLVQATLLQSMLNEVDPGFVVCQRYDSMLSDEQVGRVAEFVSPNPDVAKIFTASLKWTARPIPTNDNDHKKELTYEGEEMIIERLQEKFDALDAAFCPPS